MSVMLLSRNAVCLLPSALLATFADVAQGGKVVCPVCGETMDDDLLECPNDGTDLKLLGIPLKEEEKDKKDKKDKPERRREPGSAAAAPDSSKAKPTIKYKRHDRDGDRRPVEPPAPGSYSDRRSRIPGDKRLAAEPKPVSAAEMAPPEPYPAKLDKGIREEFERHRQHVEEQRKAADLARAGVEDSAESARARLLSSLGAPLTSLGLRVFWLPEGPRTGPVGGTEIDINLARYRLRAGFSTMMGVRALDDRNELVFLENIALGIQAPKQFSPYIVARGGAGLVKTERYRTDQLYLLTSLGVEVGVDSWLTPWIAVTPSMGYMRCTLSDAYWHSFTAKISIGF
jgi:hypothetical protein